MLRVAKKKEAVRAKILIAGGTDIPFQTGFDLFSVRTRI